VRRLHLRGKRFSKWFARDKDPVIRNGATYWWCECDCGTIRPVNGKDLTGGHSRDCGCTRTEKLNDWCAKHGMSSHPLHAIWRVIIDRCYNPKNAKYRLYGGKGITMCDKWRNSFQEFYNDLGERPPGMNFVRFDKNGPFSPEKNPIPSPAMTSDLIASGLPNENR
jgi:hypothetical protein